MFPEFYYEIATARQAEVLDAIKETGSKVKAAEKLGISYNGVKKHIKLLKAKSVKCGLLSSPVFDKTSQDIIVIADTQVDNESPTDHLEALGRFIWEKKAGHIIHIGDHWDLGSLSTYASKKEQEGRRLYDDLQGGFDAFELIMNRTKFGNVKSNHQYSPNKHFLMGNHENRLVRFISEHPVLEGCFDIGAWVADQGWDVHGFNDPLFINDVCFSHYMESSQSGRPVGGAMENKLNKFPHSFVHGHQQQYQYASRQNLLGKPHFGVCAGSFYMHDEAYRGANNTEKRGFVYMKAYKNRYGYLDYDIEFVSLERLLAEWG